MTQIYSSPPPEGDQNDLSSVVHLYVQSVPHLNRLSTCTRDPGPFLCLLAEFTSSLLAHGKGAAFFVSPDSGMLGAFETQTVDITAYTDMWGEYRDHLICKV